MERKIQLLFPNIAKIVHCLVKKENDTFTTLGTCTLLSEAGTLVTTAHNVKGQDKDLYLLLNDFRFGDYQNPYPENFRVAEVTIKNIDPINDLCILTIDQDVSSTLNISNLDEVHPGEPVTVFGFPQSNYGRVVLTQQSSEIGAKILLDNNGIESKHFVLNIQARPGQSGSPIIRNSDQSLIGILIGAYIPPKRGVMIGDIDPWTLHQTTHAVSAKYINRMIT